MSLIGYLLISTLHDFSLLENILLGDFCYDNRVNVVGECVKWVGNMVRRCGTWGVVDKMEREMGKLSAIVSKMDERRSAERL